MLPEKWRPEVSVQGAHVAMSVAKLELSQRRNSRRKLEFPDGNLLTEVVAYNARIERLRRRWNQGELGDLIDLSRTGVSELESGLRKPSLNDIVPLCEAFGIDLAQLLDGVSPSCREILGL